MSQYRETQSENTTLWPGIIMLRLLSLAPLFFFLAACAGTRNDVIKCGQGIYVATGTPDHPYGNYVNTSRNVAFKKANAFCQSKGKHVSVDNIEDGLPTHVTFRCVTEAVNEDDQPAYNPADSNKEPCN